MVARKRRITRFSRKRRKARSTWFPTIGTIWSNQDQSYYDSTFTTRLSAVPSDLVFGPQVEVFPVTPDQTALPTEQQATDAAGFSFTLRDIVEGQSWMLDRIVGNIFLRCDVNASELPPTDAWAQIKATVGFFIARSSDTDQGVPDMELNAFDPAATDNIGNPWIWRNSWILANPQSTVVAPALGISNNWNSPDWTGPRIDSKVKRRIRREHRLWMAVAAMGWDGTRGFVAGETQPQLTVSADLRILGHLVRQINTSSF